MSNKIKVIIAYNDDLTNASQAALLSSYSDFEVLGVAENGREVLSLLRKKIADVVLMQTHLPVRNGVETFRIIQQLFPSVKVILKGKTDDLELIKVLKEEKLNCYLSEKCGKEELLVAIRMVAYKGYYNDSHLAELLLAYSGEGKKKDALAKTEMEITSLVCSGYSSIEIASIKKRSKHTVDFHRSNIRRKTGCHTVAELIVFALAHHISFESRKDASDSNDV